MGQALAFMSGPFYEFAMEVSVLDKIEAAFGFRGFPKPLFYNFPIGLRFDLGGQGPNEVHLFGRAITRARKLAAATFAASDQLSAVALRYDPTVVSLHATGFLEEFSTPVSGPRVPEEELDELRPHWSAASFKPSEDAFDSLLWPSLADDLQVTPRVSWTALFIVDFARQLALHAYDYRGLDIVAMEREALDPIYSAFNTWLLEYNRAAMDEVFGYPR